MSPSANGIEQKEIPTNDLLQLYRRDADIPVNFSDTEHCHAADPNRVGSRWLAGV